MTKVISKNDFRHGYSCHGYLNRPPVQVRFSGLDQVIFHREDGQLGTVIQFKFHQ